MRTATITSPIAMANSTIIRKTRNPLLFITSCCHLFKGISRKLDHSNMQ